MGTIEDITFDADYADATYRFLLLNQRYSAHIGPTPVIFLPSVSLMTFIRVFHDLKECQDHINSDIRKLITLVISKEKIIEWDQNNNNNVSDNSIDEMYIFCGTYSDYVKMKNWDGCYKDKVHGVYLPDNLDYNLLMLGVGYIHKILNEFRQNRPVFRKFANHAGTLSRALADYFQDQIDSLDDDLGEEAQ